jgi:hypothetical protein
MYMEINWQEVITRLGGDAVFLAAAAWLVKTLISNRLVRDADEFRTRLKADADAEIERLKNSLQMVALEHQVRFSKLHERRLLIIEEVYARLASADIAFRLTLAPQCWAVTNENRKGELSEATGKAKDFFEYFEGKRIYFDDDLCALVDQMDVSFSRATAELNTLAEFGDPNERLPYKSWSDFTKAIGPLRRQLENRTREILGVSKRP